MPDTPLHRDLDLAAKLADIRSLLLAGSTPPEPWGRDDTGRLVDGDGVPMEFAHLARWLTATSPDTVAAILSLPPMPLWCVELNLGVAEAKLVILQHTSEDGAEALAREVVEDKTRVFECESEWAKAEAITQPLIAAGPTEPAVLGDADAIGYRATALRLREARATALTILNEALEVEDVARAALVRQAILTLRGDA